MQSNENTTSARPEFDQLIRDLYCDDGYALNRLRSQHAAVALAAERDRADRAEERIAKAWDAAIHYVEPMLSKADKRAAMADNPYRSKATA